MIADDIAAALPELRAHSVSRMRRPCVARQVVGVTADPDTGADVTEYGPPIFEGLCRMRDRGTSGGNDQESGGATVTVSSMEWHIPHDAPRIPIGTVVFFEDGLPAYRTTDVSDGDDMTARRYPVEVVTS